MGLIQTSQKPPAKTIPIQRLRRNNRGLGANNTVSDPQALIQAEQALAARGIDVDCYEEVLYGPTGPVYNRICAPAGSGSEGYISADLFAGDKPQVYLDYIAQVAAADIRNYEASTSEALGLPPEDLSWRDPYLPINQPNLPNYSAYQQAVTDSAAASTAARQAAEAAARQAAADAAARQAAADAAAKAAADAATRQAAETVAQKAAADRTAAEAAAQKAAADRAAAEAAQKAQSDAYNKAIADYNARQLADAIAKNSAAPPIYTTTTGHSPAPVQQDQTAGSAWKEIFGGSGSRLTTAATTAANALTQAGSSFNSGGLSSIPTWAYAAAAAAVGIYLFTRKKGR